MPVSVIDSVLFRDMFGTAAMRTVFDERATLQRYLDVEAALARVQARLGIIPEAAAREITAKARVELLNEAAVAAETEIVGYPIIAVVKGLGAACDDNLGEWAHWGATTQDIMDTGMALQIRAGLDLIEQELATLTRTLAALAEAHRATPMAGRTHLQHALPVTFGLKAAIWLAPLLRMRERLDELRPRVLVGEFAGASGTLASLGPDGLAVSDALMVELGLGQPLAPWHVARDSVAETICCLALLTGALSKIATDVMLMMTTEVAEVFEPFVSGRGASSTMPQKRNPISCEVIRGCAKLVRQHAGAALDAMEADFERATGPWHLEWAAVPEAFVLTSGALAQANFMLAGLEVHTDRMRRNLDASQGLIMAEAVMMGLAPALGRQTAHDIVYDACRKAIADKSHLKDALLTDPRIAAALTPGDLDGLLDPLNYLGANDAMIDRVLAAVS
jgi:3-carboxy-cis,cis-muconate cycloisomerase